MEWDGIDSMVVWMERIGLGWVAVDRTGLDPLMIGSAVLSASWEAGLQHQFRAAAKWAFNIIESSGQL